MVNDKVQNNLDETAGELIENIQRDDLTPVEIAEALNLFIEEGWKQRILLIGSVRISLSYLRICRCSSYLTVCVSYTIMKYVLIQRP